MNKKLFLGMFAAASMLLATSCSNEVLDGVQSGKGATVTFSLGVEDGVGSRAISDGLKAKKLVYAVYDANGTLLKVTGSDSKGQFVDDNAFENGLTDEVTVTLAKGQAYTVAFWAQNGICTAYNTDDLTAVTVNYGDENTTYNNNDETRDAFFAAVPFEVSGNKTVDVVLKRPFAQINVGVTEKDWTDAVNSGIEVEKSAVEIKNAANEINLLTGAVKGDETVVVSYASDAIPNEDLMVDTDGNGVKEKFHWLSMSYILVDDENGGAEKATLASLKYTFTPKNGEDIKFNEGLNNVPVQRNWRTNILGKLLTGDITFEITIDPVYDGDHNFPEDAGTFAELELAASMGGEVTLTENLTMPEERPFLQVSEDFILNINENVEFTTGNASNYGIIVNNGTTEINSKGRILSKGGGIGVANGANVIFNGGNLDVSSTSTSGRYLFYLTGAGSTATINGGTFDFDRSSGMNQKRAYIYAGEGTMVYVTGGTFGKASSRSDYKAGIYGSGTVIITGGTFGFDPTTWVAAGYEAVKNGDNWIVSAKESGVKWVDLGLPSGILWADRNVNAESATDIGQYYSWADIKDPIPFVENGITKIAWNWGNYEYWNDKNGDNSPSEDEMIEYNSKDNLSVIEAKDDIATNTIGDCRIPTKAEFEELVDEEKTTWTWDAEKKGYTVVSKQNGNSIFIPAGGYVNGTTYYNSVGTVCALWTSNINEGNLLQAHNIEFDSTNKTFTTSNRNIGMPIRAVKVKK